MKKVALAKQIAACLCISFGFLNMVHAANPLWTIVPMTDTNVTVSRDKPSVSVTYSITNMSKKTHNLTMTEIPGVEFSSKTCRLAGGQSCQITLTFDPNKISPSGISGGPVVCADGNSLQCYQPSAANALKVTIDTSAVNSPAPAGGGYVSREKIKDRIKNLWDQMDSQIESDLENNILNTIIPQTFDNLNLIINSTIQQNVIDNNMMPNCGGAPSC
jgi:hypothetical protein